jgi:hypothetical protein
MAIGIYSLQAELISAMSSSASIDTRHKEYDFRHTARLIIKERQCNLHYIVVILQINCAWDVLIGPSADLAERTQSKGCSQQSSV